MTARSGEFDIIRRLLAPLAEGEPGALGLRDDAAWLKPRPGHDLVLTTDAIVAGVHFLPGDPPGDIARKALRVNLSDLAAKGAVPRVYLLTLMLGADEGDAWIEAFAAGLAGDQAGFGIRLAGGDTVVTPGPLSVSITAIGEVKRGRMILRAAAQPGDDVWVSGTIGDAGLGLGVAQGRLVGDAAGFLLGRYRVPEPRVQLGGLLARHVRAGADVSDGLVADLGHVCAASGVAAVIEAGEVPLSAAARALIEAGGTRIEALITCGDDYELVFTAPARKRAAIAACGLECGVPVTRIGHIVAGSGVRVRSAAGDDLKIDRSGFTHS